MSVRNLSRLICCDIESTCWERGEQPKKEVSEIIEIGVAVINLKSLQIEQSEGIIVKPARSKISKFCTQLTTITQDQVDKGVSFSQACDILVNKYDSKNLVWGSWGQYDRKMFESQCRETYVDYPFSREHINIKNIFSVFYGASKEFNMPTALEELDMILQGTLHRGVDDAVNIASIFGSMLHKFRLLA